MKILAGILLFISAAAADTLYLRDGRAIHGTFISGNSREVRFLADGGRTQRHLITSVARIAFSDSEDSTTAAAPAAAPRSANPSSSATRTRTTLSELPAGSVITVRMVDPIDSNEADVGQRFRASLDDAIVVDGRTIVPKGADATVEVVRVEQSGTIQGREEIALALTEVFANGRRFTPQTRHAEVSAKSRTKESATIIGGTAVVGAIIGAIAGGGKGAAIGAASGAGAGAAIQAIRGQRIKVPSESRLDFTLSQPMRL